MSLKNWNNGDVLNGSDMNGLVAASNMRFASAAARTAALVGELAPTAGAVSVLLDDQSTYRYDGASAQWRPAPETLCFAYSAVGAQSIANNVITPVTGFSASAAGASTNLGGWFSASAGKFQPTSPGLYEFTGGVVFFSNTEASGIRQVGILLNSATTWVTQSTSNCHTHNLQNAYFYQYMVPTVQYLNGTTDYVYLGAFQNSGVALNISSGAAYGSFFSGKFLGG